MAQHGGSERYKIGRGKTTHRSTLPPKGAQCLPALPSSTPSGAPPRTLQTSTPTRGNNNSSSSTQEQQHQGAAAAAADTNGNTAGRLGCGRWHEHKSAVRKRREDIDVGVQRVATAGCWEMPQGATDPPPPLENVVAATMQGVVDSRDLVEPCRSAQSRLRRL